MSRAIMGNGRAAVAALVALAWVAVARPASAAVTLGSLPSPTVQALIDLGSDGAIAGDARYFDFTYVGTPAAPAAGQVQVQSVGSGATGGLRFVASWLAADGAFTSSTIGFDVAPVDGGAAIARIDLLSNGTAPVPAAETFATATTLAATPAAAPVAPLLTTFDDGRSFPVDTTAADVDSATAAPVDPQSELAITDTLTVVAGTGGVATASFVQNGFAVDATALPEPMLGLTLAAVIGLGGRRARQDSKAK